MTTTAPKDTPETLFVTDEELFRRLGVSAAVGRPILDRFDKSRCGFPGRDPLWGNRRYWPAIKEFFDKTYGLSAINGRERKSA